MEPKPKVTGPNPECRLDGDGNVVLCCTPPEQLLCVGGGNYNCVCLNPQQPPVMACEVRVQYPANDPSNVTLAPMGPWCNAAGAEIALAVMLARLLQRP